MNDNSQSSIRMTYNKKESPFSYEVKIYINGEDIKTPMEAEVEAQKRLTSLITKNEA